MDAWLVGEITRHRFIELTGHSPNCIGERGVGIETCDCGGPFHVTHPSGASLGTERGWQGLDGHAAPYLVRSRAHA